MKNTGITYTSAERSPVILLEMAELLPPLSAEQLDALEADLIKNGCYSPIIVNEDMVIIDGHNYRAIQQGFEANGLSVESLEEAWNRTIDEVWSGKVDRPQKRNKVKPKGQER